MAHAASLIMGARSLPEVVATEYSKRPGRCYGRRNAESSLGPTGLELGLACIGQLEIPMPVVGIDHVQLAMPAGQEQQARRFYGEALGLPEKPKPADMAARGGCWFESEGVKIHLGVDKNFRAATKAHPGLLVSDLRVILERCRSQGCEDIDETSLPGYLRAFVSDPFGNRIELMQKL